VRTQAAVEEEEEEEEEEQRKFARCGRRMGLQGFCRFWVVV
jgi:hypothetical protein